MQTREIKVTLKEFSGAILTDYYDMTDEFGDVVFFNVLGTSLVNGVTYSVNKLSNGFLITSYPQPYLKFVYATSLQPTNSSEIINRYHDSVVTDVDIETLFGVGTPASIGVTCSYTKDSFFISESIFVDKTNSTTFWNDIKGWLYLNNLDDIEHINNMYKIVDDTNMAFMSLTY